MASTFGRTKLETLVNVTEATHIIDDISVATTVNDFSS